MLKKEPYRFIISGGGTGGHIYPAIAIANTIKDRFPDAEILFVGALGRMEMQKVPEAGYKIVGLWISGIQRKLTLDNLSFPLKLVSSLYKANKVVRSFKPHAVIGVGGFASGPTLQAASKQGIPTLIQEQNSFAGLTNRLLAKKVNTICVAHEGLEKFFPKEKIVLTGNPVRKDISGDLEKREEAMEFFGLSPAIKTILVIGGSLGARTLNESVLKDIEKINSAGVQLIWQTGKYYFQDIMNTLKSDLNEKTKVFEFLKEMNLAYAAADVVISRAGALSISELCLVKKPVIFVPSPNVAEDHQTQNAKALVEKDAAIMVRDVEAKEKLVDQALQLLYDQGMQNILKENIGKLAKRDAAENIVDEIIKLIK
ncbi:MAG: undecaprenyldiphospho-muramoylpentapeptide beta-N-acetylglucosaminyltransferase [Bacteroidota bacterium]|nr:undecaprenyldiphospho-muramoylpentapeptide beta-N-acetylglucosaminyltransferase [Bacteroidota bacterium]